MMMARSAAQLMREVPREFISVLTGVLLLGVACGAAAAQDVPMIAVEIDGNPVQPGQLIAVADTPIAGTSDPIEVTLRNAGSAPLELDQFEPPELDGDGSMMYLLDTSSLSSTVGPGESTSFSVVFFPYQTGRAQATLIIATNDPATPKFSIELSGTGTPMANP